MNGFTRTDQSIIGRWWWATDSWLMSLIAVAAITGLVLVTAASPPVAQRIGLDNYSFIYRHLTMLVPAVAVAAVISLMSLPQIRLTASCVFWIALILTAATLVVGPEIKGARRWIHVLGVSLQPSEFVKPAFAVVAAWLFSLPKERGRTAAIIACYLLFFTVIGLLARQPDLGMAFVVSSVWFIQFFLAGLSIVLVIFLAIFGMSAMVAAYVFLPHVASRIDRFLDPSQGDTYQVDRSLEAFMNGGMFGTGPGQGTVKFLLPDAHADFIFAVAGEELGILTCLAIVGLFLAIILRSTQLALRSGSLFRLLAISGLCTQIALQALINMGSSLHLIPTKGMTLPFMSYGGSSLVALGLLTGMLLALSRAQPNELKEEA